MKIIFLSGLCNGNSDRDICLFRVAGLALGLLLGVGAAALWAGFEWGRGIAVEVVSQDSAAEMRALLAAEQRAIAGAKAEQRAHLDAMALKIAELQTHLIRLDALGERLVELGKLDPGEFDFSVPPPIGGTDEGLVMETQGGLELQDGMNRLSELLGDRERKLVLLEKVMEDRGLLHEVTLSGKPVKQGWISSWFGTRTDPFHGRKSMHRGVDFAGKRGAEVIAVAGGVVTRSERAAGYGNVVEIRHADGYLSLYAHNQENLVAVGDLVGKGQTIALLGSTGRSSGPHVHFEVHKDGKLIDPMRFVRAQ